MQPTNHVIDITPANFEAEILQASMHKPVLVDFWAEWCGPCKSLGPILEELAESYAGAFRLAKVDVDANPMLASQFGAQSIPMVFAIFQGGLVDRFTGALPRQELTRFIDAVLERCGVPRPEGEEERPLPEGSPEQEAAWRSRVAQSGEDGEALIGLARLEMGRGQSTEARGLLESVPGAHEQSQEARALLAVLDLGQSAEVAGDISTLRDQLANDPSSPSLRYSIACAAGATARFAEALETLVDLVAERSPEVQADARRAAATILEAAGRGDDRVESQRRRLSRLLF